MNPGRSASSRGQYGSDRPGQSRGASAEGPNAKLSNQVQKYLEALVDRFRYRKVEPEIIRRDRKILEHEVRLQSQLRPGVSVEVLNAGLSDSGDAASASQGRQSLSEQGPSLHRSQHVGPDALKAELETERNQRVRVEEELSKASEELRNLRLEQEKLRMEPSHRRMVRLEKNGLQALASRCKDERLQPDFDALLDAVEGLRALARCRASEPQAVERMSGGERELQDRLNEALLKGAWVASSLLYRLFESVRRHDQLSPQEANDCAGAVAGALNVSVLQGIGVLEHVNEGCRSYNSDEHSTETADRAATRFRPATFLVRDRTRSKVLCKAILVSMSGVGS
jgi:hypothetical protein